MPYFTRAGANRANLSGAESRGYHVFRRGSRVRVVWGPIEFRRMRMVTPTWSSATLYKDFLESSEQAAVALLKKIVGDRLREGYSKLPPGCPIRPAAYARGVTRRR
jgi:hypothetical protein